MVLFAESFLLQRSPGQSSSAQPQPRRLVGGALEVAPSSTANTIRFVTAGQGTVLPVTAHERLATVAVGDTFDLEPFRFRVAQRGIADTGEEAVALQLTGLMPNLTNIPFNYHVSWLTRRNQGGKQHVRAWEINPPEGVQYSGPFSVLLSPWWGITWLFFDFDPNEQALLNQPVRDDIQLA
jgi:hypothetical protein